MPFLLFPLLISLLSACTVAPPASRAPVESPPSRPPPAETQQQPAPVESRLPEPAPEKLSPPEPDGRPAEEPVRAPSEAAERPEASSAVIALLDTARQQAAAGQGEQAAANLERALRIEPKNPWLWHRLGVLKLQQGEYRAAIDLANKSNSLAAGNRRLMAGNWELLARAHSALGNEAEAESARRKAEELGIQRG